MDSSSPWVSVVVAIVAAFGGAPLFKYLAARVQNNAASNAAQQALLDKRIEAFETERSAFYAEQRKEGQSYKLQNMTYRDAMTDQNLAIGRLEGENAHLRARVAELESEVSRLRGGMDD